MASRVSAGKARRKAKAAPRASTPRKSGAKAKSSPRSRTKSKSVSKAGTKAKPRAARAIELRKAKQVVLLSGGNPQIAKGDGDAPVQAYIAALPGWKRDVAKRLDALIVRALPSVRKAVKWNSPMYGIDGQGWFLGVHAFAQYIKLAFFRGTSLRPVPPGPSQNEGTRYFHIHEGDELDRAQLGRWVKQAAALPGGDGLGR